MNKKRFDIPLVCPNCGSHKLSIKSFKNPNSKYVYCNQCAWTDDFKRRK